MKIGVTNSVYFFHLLSLNIISGNLFFYLLIQIYKNISFFLSDLKNRIELKKFINFKNNIHKTPVLLRNSDGK